MTPPALALRAPSPALPDPAPLDPLRRRFAATGGATTEAVLVDFVEDDLAAAREALDELSAWAALVEACLNDPRASPRALLALAGEGAASEAADGLSAAIAGVRRRMARLAGRL